MANKMKLEECIDLGRYRVFLAWSLSTICPDEPRWLGQTLAVGPCLSCSWPGP